MKFEDVKYQVPFHCITTTITLVFVLLSTRIYQRVCNFLCVCVCAMFSIFSLKYYLMCMYKIMPRSQYISAYRYLRNGISDFWHIPTFFRASAMQSWSEIIIYRRVVSCNCIMVHLVSYCIISLRVWVCMWNVKCAVIQHRIVLYVVSKYNFNLFVVYGQVD